LEGVREPGWKNQKWEKREQEEKCGRARSSGGERQGKENAVITGCRVIRRGRGGEETRSGNGVVMVQGRRLLWQKKWPTGFPAKENRGKSREGEKHFCRGKKGKKRAIKNPNRGTVGDWKDVNRENFYIFGPGEISQKKWWFKCGRKTGETPENTKRGSPFQEKADLGEYKKKTGLGRGGKKGGNKRPGNELPSQWERGGTKMKTEIQAGRSGENIEHRTLRQGIEGWGKWGQRGKMGGGGGSL